MVERESKLVRVCCSTVCVLFSLLQLQILNLVIVNRKYCNFQEISIVLQCLTINSDCNCNYGCNSNSEIL
jgi:hypothetical protein